MNDKVLALLGFASKAGALAFGSANAIEAVKRRQAEMVVYASDISQKSLKELLFHCRKGGVNAFEIKGTDMQGLSNAVGKKCAVAAVLCKNFKDPLISYLSTEVT